MTFPQGQFDLPNRENTCESYAPVGVESHAGDLLTMHTLKNTEAVRSFP